MAAEKLVRVIKRHIDKALNNNLKKMVIHGSRLTARCALCPIAKGAD